MAVISQIIVSSIYILIGILTAFGVYFLFVINRILLKHRSDNAPLTTFFLNKEESRKYITAFKYPAIAIFITGIATVLQRFLGTPSFDNIPFIVAFFASYIFGLVTIIVLLYVIFIWYKRMRRFV